MSAPADQLTAIIGFSDVEPRRMAAGVAVDPGLSGCRVCVGDGNTPAKLLAFVEGCT